MTECHKLIYSSTAVQPFSEKSLEDLMIQARNKNQNFGVTGCLVYHNSRVIQYLEGHKVLVESVYNSILNDPRHKNITLLCSDSVKHRAFKQWYMALKYIPEGHLNDYKSVYELFEEMMDAHLVSRLSDKAIHLFEGYLHYASLSYGNLSH